MVDRVTTPESKPQPLAAYSTITDQLSCQLMVAAGVTRQQRALLADVADRRRDALARVVRDQLRRRHALLDQLEGAVNTTAADADARAVQRSWHTVREGRLSVLAAGLAVALEVDAILDPTQRAALETFSPRLVVSASTRCAMQSLLERLARASSEREAAGRPSDATITALSRALVDMLDQVPVPAEVTRVAARHLEASLRLTGRPGQHLVEGVSNLALVGRVCTAAAAALNGDEDPVAVLPALAELLDSPLLPALTQSERLKRHALELVMLAGIDAAGEKS